MVGKPWYWKVMTFVFVLFPKILIFKFTCQIGAEFLMDTSSITNVIVNAVALTFILQIDNMAFNLLGRTTERIMEALEDLAENKDVSVIVKAGSQYSLQRGLNGFWRFQNGRGEAVCILTVYFVIDYYLSHCTLRANGSWLGGWVSHPEFYPKSVTLTPLAAFFPRFFGNEHEVAPYFTVPYDGSN